ncbi:MAG: right-handed parallel beta-helix repeat-containing protein [Candidatus Eisenbacteria bacterium]|nr:right-handed parallel beta-helix repeat-containing protein [Candidatus Eisenbacteria bacterium]
MLAGFKTGSSTHKGRRPALPITRAILALLALFVLASQLVPGSALAQASTADLIPFDLIPADSVLSAARLAGTVIYVAPLPPASPPGDGTREHPAGTLAQALEIASYLGPGCGILMAPGTYRLSPSAYLDSTCGNCEDPAETVPATVGLRISSPLLRIKGSSPDSVIIYTQAGYGLLFEDCENCALQGVSVTGGERDTSGKATDAAIVVRRSNVVIENCRIEENLGDSATVAKTVVGIMGICGREQARMHIRHCAIVRNSWDGIALYRDATARIEDCLVDGVDSGRGGANRGGRGVGIGLTWNAKASVIGNRVCRYWKGIGVFVNAEAQVRENVVEDILTWGIALWDADQGLPFADISDNAIFRTGACGISVARGRTGGREDSRIEGNLLARTGQNAKYDSGEVYCKQQALAIDSSRPATTIAHNGFFENREPGDRRGASDQDRKALERVLAPLLAHLRTRAVTAESECIKEFGAAEKR